MLNSEGRKDTSDRGAFCAALPWTRKEFAIDDIISAMANATY